MDAKHSQALAERVLAEAKKLAPGANLVVALSSGRSANTRFAQNEITSTGDVDETSFELMLARGKRSARCQTNQTDSAAVRTLVERTEMMARLSPEDPEYMPPLPPQHYKSVPAASDPATEALTAEARAKVAAHVIGVAEPQGQQLAGFVQHEGSFVTVANSAGLLAQHRSSNYELTMTSRTADGSGSGWAGAYAVKASEVDVPALAKVACDKAALAKAPTALDPGRYTVILEPAAVAELLHFLTQSLSARQADEGRSFFAKKEGGSKIGEKLFADGVTLKSDPQDPRLPAMPFDWDGLPLEPLTAVAGGVLQALTYDRFYADKQKAKPTGSRDAWSLAPGQATRESLIADCKRGVLITRFWYTRWVDPQTMVITGLTRDGTFLVEDGRISRPLHNFRFNESPVTMLKNVEAMSRQTARWYDLAVPALRTSGFNLASVSEAV